jgi:hypothetical protein
LTGEIEKQSYSRAEEAPRFMKTCKGIEFHASASLPFRKDSKLIEQKAELTHDLVWQWCICRKRNPTLIQYPVTILTPWSRVLLDKLVVSQLVMKFPVFYAIRRFITELHINPPLVSVLNHMNSFHTIPSYCFKAHFNIILPSMPRSL